MGGGKEGRKEGGREEGGGRDGGRKGVKEGGRDGGRKGEREMEEGRGRERWKKEGSEGWMECCSCLLYHTTNVAYPADITALHHHR